MQSVRCYMPTSHCLPYSIFHAPPPFSSKSKWENFLKFYCKYKTQLQILWPWWLLWRSHWTFEWMNGWISTIHKAFRTSSISLLSTMSLPSITLSEDGRGSLSISITWSFKTNWLPCFTPLRITLWTKAKPSGMNLRTRLHWQTTKNHTGLT